MSDTPAVPPKSAGPNKKLIVGCGVGCCVVLAAILTMLVIGIRGSAQVVPFAQGFVREAVSADPATAWQSLHGNKQQTVAQDAFVAEWQAVRAKVGELRSVTPAEGVGMDLERSVMILPFAVVGSVGTVTVTVEVNPKDKPPAIVDYRMGDASTAP